MSRMGEVGWEMSTRKGCQGQADPTPVRPRGSGRPGQVSIHLRRGCSSWPVNGHPGAAPPCSELGFELELSVEQRIVGAERPVFSP